MITEKINIKNPKCYKYQMAGTIDEASLLYNDWAPIFHLKYLFGERIRAEICYDVEIEKMIA